MLATCKTVEHNVRASFVNQRTAGLEPMHSAAVECLIQIKQTDLDHPPMHSASSQARCDTRCVRRNDASRTLDPSRISDTSRKRWH